jgi:hypothetical protein
MAAIEYKLRATAIRTASFATNFVSTKDFTVVRSFSNEVSKLVEPSYSAPISPWFRRTQSL